MTNEDASDQVVEANEVEVAVEEETAEGRDERLQENLDRGQSSHQQIRNNVADTANKGEQGAKDEQAGIDAVAGALESAGETNAENNEVFRNSAETAEDSVLEQKSEFEKEIEKRSEKLDYDQEEFEDDVSAVGKDLGTLTEMVTDLGFFGRDALRFKNSNDLNIEINDESNQAYMQMGERRQQVVDSRQDEDIPSQRDSLNNSAGDLDNTVNMIGQYMELQDRAETYEAIADLTVEEVQKLVDTDFERNPEGSEFSDEEQEIAQDAIEAFANQSEDRAGSFDPSKEKEVRTALLTYQARAADAVAEQAERVNRSKDNLRDLRDEFETEAEWYDDVREEVTDFGVLEEIQQVGPGVTQALQDKGYETVMDVAALDEDTLESVFEYSNVRNQIVSRSDEIIQKAGQRVSELAEEYGLRDAATNSIDRLATREDYRPEEVARRQLEAIYMMADDGEFFAGDPLSQIADPDSDNYDVSEIDGYQRATSEREEVYDQLNDLLSESEQMEVPEAQGFFVTGEALEEE